MNDAARLINPSKRRDSRAEKAKIICAFERRASILFAYNTRGQLVLDKHGAPVRAQNGWASAFWAGVDGMTRGVRVPTPRNANWAFYAAGRDVRRAAIAKATGEAQS